MLRNVIRFSILLLLNYFVIFSSSSLDVEQLNKDIIRFTTLERYDIQLIYFLICASVSAMTLFLIYFFKPFIKKPNESINNIKGKSHKSRFFILK